MNNILVPFDFSPYALSAGKAAAFIARKTDATIHLIHVVNGPVDWESLPVREQQRYPEVEGRIVEAEIRLDKVSSDAMFKDCDVQFHVTCGVAYDRIAEYAKDHKMSLIVMGAHGADEKNTMFIGSTAQRVIRLATCPVLSVKRDTTLRSISRILFPSDFEENITKVVDLVKDLAGSLKADVDFLYVNTPGNFTDTHTAEKRMENFIPVQKQVKFTPFIFNDTDREKGILSFISRRRPDLLVMITHARKGKPVYLVSVTDTLLFNTDIPILSIVLKKG